MSEARFTKGPWKCCHSEYPDGSWNGDYEISADGLFVAGVSRSDVINEADFNAPLIAAAPEMYEMLESVAEDYGIYNPVHKQIQALLAKARGES